MQKFDHFNYNIVRNFKNKNEILHVNFYKEMEFLAIKLNEELFPAVNIIIKYMDGRAQYMRSN